LRKIKKQEVLIAGKIMATKIEDSTIKKKKDYFKIKNLRFVLEIYPNLLTKTSYKVIIYILDILNKNEIIIKK
jgi:hypothetical protein